MLNAETRDKKFHVLSTTEGCATNLLENSSYRKQFENQGLKASDSAQDADVILINTCGYNQDMESKAAETIATYQARFPGKEIVLAGCMPKINPRLVREKFAGLEVRSLPADSGESQSYQFDRADFATLSSKHKLVLLLRPILYKFENFFGYRLSPLHNLLQSVIVNEDFFLITVSTGCLGSCTFCAIKRAKGRLRSRPLAPLMSEFAAGLKAGRKKFWLLGDDIGCWGQDLGLSLVDLLKAFTQRTEDFELVVNYVDPQFLVRYGSELQQVFQDRRIIGMNLPIQSGSDRVLRDMSRQYQANPVYDTLRGLKRLNPGLAVKTNLIVGFPGETWQDFAMSLRSVFHFDAILALKFTPRPQTPAAEMQTQIPEAVKNLRMLIMNLAISIRHGLVALGSFARPEKSLKH